MCAMWLGKLITRTFFAQVGLSGAAEVDEQGMQMHNYKWKITIYCMHTQTWSASTTPGIALKCLESI